jgi:hypothetical protein
MYSAIRRAVSEELASERQTDALPNTTAPTAVTKNSNFRAAMSFS